MDTKKILIVSGCKYPEGDAGSVRIHSLAKLFLLCGKDTVVIGKGMTFTKETQTYDGVQYYSFRHHGHGKLGKIIDRLSYRKRLENHLKIYGEIYSHILIVDIPFAAIKHVVNYAKQSGIQLLHDSLEWYSPSEFSLGSLHPMYRHRDTLNKRIITTDYKVIAISKYLEEYFKGKGCRTIRIPAILTTNDDNLQKATTGRKIITYAGLPEKKDKLVEIIDAFSELSIDKKSKLELRVIGITLSELKKRFGLSDAQTNKFADGVTFYGRVPREKVLMMLKETHFTIFYRDASERYAKAGFPTKVAESTSQGIPVITNYSSDLMDYLIDRENSIVISESTQGIREALEYACEMSNEQYERMSLKAKETYNTSFYFAVYKNVMEGFLV